MDSGRTGSGESAPSGTLLLDRFEVLSELGRGGYGRVLRCYDRRDGREVALKQLSRFGPEAILSFKREFRSLADIHHPNVVRLGELLEGADGRWAFTMELVPGVDFLTWVRCDAASPGFDEARLRSGLLQLLAGLDALHRAGMLHRDVKPDNIRVTPEGRVVLLDFGLVKQLRAGVQSTDHSALCGTADYMAPEQLSGSAGPKSDLYAVGVLLYEALTGQTPFRGSALSVLMQKVEREIEPPRQHDPQVPDDLERLCVRLLSREPRARADASEAMRLLGAESSPGPPISGSIDVPYDDELFVGRAAQLAELEGLWQSARRDGLRVVLVEGPSGIGKTALVEHFVRALSTREPELLVFRARCHAAEQVRYKMWDGIVDSLCRHLLSLSTDFCRTLLPDEPGQLSKLFPVLSRVKAMASPLPWGAQRDAVAERVRAFAAFGELLEKLARECPLVLCVDDLQWGDADSLAILQVLLALRRSPRVLLLATTRPPQDIDEPLQGKLAELRQQHRRFAWVELPPLEHDVARGLAARLLGLGDEHELSQQVARETGGNPWLAREMAEALRTSTVVDAQGPNRLAMVLRARVSGLGREARRIMEVLAVAGGPQPPSMLRAALELDSELVALTLSVLRANRLVRSSGDGRWACYHDQIREAIAADVEDGARVGLHARLAREWERAGGDPLRVAEHWQQANAPERALPWLERGAREAAAAGAYERAAQLYATALEQYERVGAPLVTLHSLREQLAESLASAGRSAASAQVLLAMLDGIEGPEGVALLVRAAERLLHAGRVVEGLDAASRAFATVGMDWPRSSATAALRLVWHKARLRVRGLDLALHASPPSAEAQTELNTLWQLSVPIASADLLRGAELFSRHLRLALEQGAVSHSAYAVLNEAGIAGLSQPAGEASRRLLERAAPWVRACDEPALAVYEDFVRGSCAGFEADFRRSSRLFAQAASRYASECPENAWMRTNVRTQQLHTWFLTGAHATLRQQARIWMVEANLREDFFAEASISIMGYGWLRHCLDDEPGAALDELERVMAPWPAGSLGIHHAFELIARHYCLQYVGAPRAHEHWQRAWAKLSGTYVLRMSFFRELFQVFRVEARVRAAAETGAPLSALGVGRRLVRQLERSTTPHGRALSCYALAQCALLDSDRERACEWASRAKQLLGAAGDFRVAAADLLLAVCQRNDRARSVEAELLRWYEREGWVNPARALASHLAVYPALRRC